MILTTGAHVGAYELLAPLGQGGMGQVWAAHDPRLGRRVALKVLPPEVDADPERVERFEREARAVAALNHPNIVTIHSVERLDGLRFLTMELVEGKTLAEAIPKGGLRLERFLAIALPLADAISAAHEKGITHRDLKPQNVMVMPDGRVKVLDFGLAKLQATAPVAMGSTTTAVKTAEGHIVGTVAYMSPEQAQGLPVDHRTDIFSLGVVLYEMATGERPFRGDTNVATIAAIVKDTARAVTELNRDVPRDLARIIKRCLQKDPERRYQTAKDVRNELDTLKDEVLTGELATTAAAARRGGRAWTALWPAGAAVGLLAVAAAYLLLVRGMDERAASPVQATFTQLTFQAGLETFPSLSPDGKWFVYVSAADGDEDIYLQSVGGQNALNLTKDSPAIDTHPAFSPDGERIAFRSEREGGGIFVMGRTGEAVRRIGDASGFNPSWSPDGREIVFSTTPTLLTPTAAGTSPLAELWIARVDTGAKRLLLNSPAGMQPHWSPNGHRVAFTGLARDARTIPSTGGQPVAVVAESGRYPNPVWSPDGRFLYSASDRGGSFNLVACPRGRGFRACGGPAAASRGAVPERCTPDAFQGRRPDRLLLNAGTVEYSENPVRSDHGDRARRTRVDHRWIKILPMG